MSSDQFTIEEPPEYIRQLVAKLYGAREDYRIFACGGYQARNTVPVSVWDSEALDWEYRWYHLQLETPYWNATVVCPCSLRPHTLELDAPQKHKTVELQAHQYARGRKETIVRVGRCEQCGAVIWAEELTPPRP